MATNKTKRSRFSIIWVILLLAGVGLMFFGTVTIKRQRAISEERKTFAVAEAKITSFVNKIAELAPSTKEFTKECRYGSAKFNKGPLGCSIYGKVRYEGLAEVEKLMSVGSTLIPSEWQYIQDNTFNYDYLPKSEIKNSIYEFKGMSCRVSYSYEVDERQQIITIDGRKNLIVMADCTGSALREYYKVVDY